MPTIILSVRVRAHTHAEVTRWGTATELFTIQRNAWVRKKWSWVKWLQIYKERKTWREREREGEGERERVETKKHESSVCQKEGAVRQREGSQGLAIKKNSVPSLLCVCVCVYVHACYSLAGCLKRPSSSVWNVCKTTAKRWLLCESFALKTLAQVMTEIL